MSKIFYCIEFWWKMAEHPKVSVVMKQNILTQAIVSKSP